MNSPHFMIPLKLHEQETLVTNLVVVQYDNKFTELRFVLSYNDTPIDHNVFSMVTMVNRMPDGSSIECECDIKQDYISYLLCYDETYMAGQVVAELVMYGSDEERKSSQRFQYVIIPTLAIGIDPSKFEELPVLQSLISKVLTLESNVTTSEELRQIAEGIRQSNESQRIANETLRISQESTRETNESARQASIQAMIEEYSTLVTELTNNTCQMVVYQVEQLTEVSLQRLLFTVPQGYDYDITNVRLISYGEASGLTDVNTSLIKLTDQADVIISEQLFNDFTPFPSNNSFYSFTIQPDFITENATIKLHVVNSELVNTPQFLLQINYLVRKL